MRWISLTAFIALLLACAGDDDDVNSAATQTRAAEQTEIAELRSDQSVATATRHRTSVPTATAATATTVMTPTSEPSATPSPSTTPEATSTPPPAATAPPTSTATTYVPPATPSPAMPIIAEVEAPSWWVVPFEPGWGNPDEGRLYFGIGLENRSDSQVSVGVSFNAYEADGTPFPGCFAPGGEGPGVTADIAPHETALVKCWRSIVPRTLGGLQVTARLWDIMPLVDTPAPVEVVESGFEIQLSSPMQTLYEPYALVRSLAADDVRVQLLFRFYSDQGVQIDTCESTDVTIEAEVAQRVSCFVPILVDTVSPQPVSVRVEARRPPF
jgi:hypothetical protein